VLFDPLNGKMDKGKTIFIAYLAQAVFDGDTCHNTTPPVGNLPVGIAVV
jgi:hypothetical protein